MKAIRPVTLICTLLFVCFTGGQYLIAQKTKALYIEAIIQEELDETAREEMEYRIESTFAVNLKLNFKCVDVLTRSVLRKELHNEFVEITSGESSGNPEMLGRLCRYDYFLKISVQMLSPEKVNVSAVVLQKKPFQVIADAQLLGKNMDVYQTARKVAVKLVKELSENEFCPYTGTLTLDHVTIRKDHKTEEKPVTVYDQQKKQMCYGTEKSIYSLDMRQDTHWELLRVGRGAAVGQLRSEINEMIEESEETDCYSCSSGRVGGRSHSITTIKRFFTDKVSGESSGENPATNDARVAIKFHDDSTYTVIIKATSVFEKNTTITTRETATGTCDPINETSVMETSNTVFIRVTLGPFNGVPSDRELSGSGVLDLPSATTGEKEELTYNFRLSR